MNKFRVFSLLAAVTCFAAFSAVLPGCRGRGKGSCAVEIDGTVMIKVSNSSVWKPIRSGEKVSEGDCLKTGAGSGGTVSVKDDVINLRMGRSTEVEVDRLGMRDGQTEIHLRLHGGDTFSRVDKQSAKYFVRTPVAIMGVIGTAFRVTVWAPSGTVGETGATRVAVVDGDVSVTVGDEKKLLKKGRFMEIDENGFTDGPAPFVLPDEIFDGQPLVSFFDDELRSAVKDLLRGDSESDRKKKPRRPKKKRPGAAPRYHDGQPEETRSDAGMDVDPGSTGSDLPPWAAPGPPPDNTESIQDVLED